MIDRNLLIRRADEDDVPPATVERDYVLTHALTAIAAHDVDARLAFKGGTALRLCYFEDYRYSADLDFSLLGGFTRDDAIQLIAQALEDCRADLGFTELGLGDRMPPRIEYVGPLGRKTRSMKLDLDDQELVEQTIRRPIAERYPDQSPADCLAYALEEVAAEKLRCVIQRLQCRDLFDLHELFVIRGLEVEGIWPVFERKARHRGIQPERFAERFEQRMAEYERRWAGELGEYLAGELPHLDGVARAVRRALRPVLRS